MNSREKAEKANQKRRKVGDTDDAFQNSLVKAINEYCESEKKHAMAKASAKANTIEKIHKTDKNELENLVYTMLDSDTKIVNSQTDEERRKEENMRRLMANRKVSEDTLRSFAEYFRDRLK